MVSRRRVIAWRVAAVAALGLVGLGIYTLYKIAEAFVKVILLEH